MADLPILFSAPMVRALIAGTKTQTRRILTVPNLAFDAVFNDDGVWYIGDALTGNREAKLPVRYKTSDRLYVREHWRVSQRWDSTAPRGLPPRTMTIFCEAGGSIANQKSGKWEPDNDYPPFRPDWVGKHRQAMHMPKWASRITLIVEGVKVERLNDCSDEDAIAEGIEGVIAPVAGRDIDIDGFYWAGGPQRMYRELWERINGLGSWAVNPWVVAYTFRRIMGSIDQIEKEAS